MYEIAIVPYYKVIPDFIALDECIDGGLSCVQLCIERTPGEQGKLDPATEFWSHSSGMYHSYCALDLQKPCKYVARGQALSQYWS